MEFAKRIDRHTEGWSTNAVGLRQLVANDPGFVVTGIDADARRRVVVEPDRRSAIRAALAGAAPGDVVLIAGKGHEDYQIIGETRSHFDDVEVAIEAIAELSDAATDRG